MDASRANVLLQTVELEEPFFGAGGSRRGTLFDDYLRAAYITTRLSLLEKKLDASSGPVRDERYFELRGQLLKRSFSKRKTNREVLQAAAAAEENQNSSGGSSGGGSSVAPSVNGGRVVRYKVVDEYAFTGMHQLFDHHAAAVTRCVFANGDRTRLAMCCVDGMVSVVKTDDPSPITAPPPSKLDGQLNPNISFFKFPRFPSPTTSGSSTSSSFVSSGRAFDVCWSPSNEYLLVAYACGYAVLFDSSSRRPIRAIRESSAISCCSFSPDNPNHFLLGSSSGQCTLYNASTGQTVCHISPPSPNPTLDGVTCCVFGNKNTLWIGCSGGIVKAFRWIPQSKKFAAIEKVVLRSGVPIHSLSFHAWNYRRNPIRELLVSTPGAKKTLFVFRVGDDDDRLQVRKGVFFSVQNSGRQSMTVVRSTFCPLTPSSRDGACIVSGGEDGTINIFDIVRFGTPKNPLINSLNGHNAPVLDVAWAYDETLLASCDSHGVVILWKRVQEEITDE